MFELGIEILIGRTTYHTNIEGQNFISSRCIYKIFISYETKTADTKEYEVFMPSRKRDELCEMFGWNYRPALKQIDEIGLFVASMVKITSLVRKSNQHRHPS
jgi:hypothetical protein